MTPATADLSDDHPDGAIVDPAHGFADFGGVVAFTGSISTVRCFEDNSLVRVALEEAGAGRVLVVDGSGSYRCALVGDRLAAVGRDNSWSGIIVNGCVRDAAELAETAIGIRALGTHPRRSTKRGEGERDITVSFGGVTFDPGAWVYADADGILVLPEPAG